MITIREDTTLVGVSELRTNFDKICAALGKSKVILEKRHKPVAVIMPIDKYNRMEALVDAIEDAYFAGEAVARDRKSKSSDYIDLAELERRLSAK